jgi:hypothetical protein
MQKELSTDALEITSENGIVNKINVNKLLNDLLVKISLYLGVLKSTTTDY